MEQNYTRLLDLDARELVFKGSEQLWGKWSCCSLSLLRSNSSTIGFLTKPIGGTIGAKLTSCVINAFRNVLPITTTFPLFLRVAQHIPVIPYMWKNGIRPSVATWPTISGSSLKRLEHKLATRFRWVNITPFDIPVVPDENGSAHRSLWWTSSQASISPERSAASSSSFQFMAVLMHISLSTIIGSPRPFTCILKDVCKFRFEPCGCSYDSHWRFTWSLTSGPVGLVEVRASWFGHPR